MEVHCTDLPNQPDTNSLYRDYARDFEKVSLWYNPGPVDFSDWCRRAEQVTARSGFPRKRLVETLQDYNSRIGAGEATRENLRRLAADDAVAIVSGQQVGLLGGPAYSVYKAATALQLARELRVQGLNAVPIFWLATNDSDFEEIRTAHYLTSESDELELRLGDCRSDPNQMTGSIGLEGVSDLLEQFSSGLSAYPFAAQAVQALSIAYSEGSTLGQAFGSLLMELFRAQGLILLDPLLPGLRRNLQDFYEVCLRQRDPLTAALQARSKELVAAGYSPQVRVDESETLLFLSDLDRRVKLRFEEGCYLTKGASEFRENAQGMLKLVGSQPERLTPGVLLRPLLQDYLLPTLAYIGGPAEICYFAQIQAISHFFERDLLILPRASLTIIDRKSRRLLEKYELTPEEVLSESSEELAERIVKTTRAAELLAQLESLEQDLKDRLETLQPGLDELDPTLKDMLSGVQEKMLYQLGKLNYRFVQNQKQRQPALKRHLAHLQNRITPRGKSQERVLGFCQFIAEEGPSLLSDLLPHLTPSACHKICFL